MHTRHRVGNDPRTVLGWGECIANDGPGCHRDRSRLGYYAVGRILAVPTGISSRSMQLLPGRVVSVCSTTCGHPFPSTVLEILMTRRFAASLIACAVIAGVCSGCKTNRQQAVASPVGSQKVPAFAPETSYSANNSPSSSVAPDNVALAGSQSYTSIPETRLPPASDTSPTSVTPSPDATPFAVRSGCTKPGCGNCK